jgi:8-oxo-dGTP diphosphatase
MTTIYLIRHGKAGEREEWHEPDHLRPLTKPGRKQAQALASRLAGESITRVLTSPHIRCRQSVEPLAELIGVPVENADALIEGAPVEESVALIDKLAGENAVLCTHGDVVGNLLWYLEQHGVRMGEPLMQKASIWVLDTEAGAVISARYEPPPT